MSYIPGINIQWPISAMILDGRKTIETRTYALPKKYIGIDLAIIETPGPQGTFRARIVGVIRFGEPFRYQNQNDFYKDISKHGVDRNSKWKWSARKPKWGWPIVHLVTFKKSKIAPEKKGIVFTSQCRINT